MLSSQQLSLHFEFSVQNTHINMAFYIPLNFDL